MIRNVLVTCFCLLIGLGLNAQEFLFFESFNDGPAGGMPNGFSAYNVDENTIATFFSDAGVTFNDGWEVRAWQDLGDFGGVASSSSDYSPAGTADDWMISPDIDIDGPGAMLTWQGLAVNGGGYEVYISTTGNNLSDFTSLSPIETIASENEFTTGGTFSDRSFDLTAYDGETIWVAFRNNNSSTESRLIFINDLGVLAPPAPIEAGVTSRPTVEYGWLAIDQTAPLTGLWEASAKNFGFSDISNVQIALNVDSIDIDNNPVRIYSALSDVIPTLASGESIEVTIDGTFTPDELRLYKFSHEITFDEDGEDDFEGNQSSTGIYMIISENFTSRSGTYINPDLDDPIDPEIDDFILFYTPELLDITGSVGQVIDIVQPAEMDSVFLQFFEPDGDVYATLYEFADDTIGDLIATTETRNFSGITGGVLEGFAFDCPIPLVPGQYFVAYEDPLEGSANFTYTNYHTTENRQFFRFDGGDWTPFNNAPIIYANFTIGDNAVPLTMAEIDAAPSSLAYTFIATPNGTACDYTWDFGDGNTGTGSPVEHVYEAEGDYEVCVLVTNNSDESAEDCLNVTGVCALEIVEGTITPSSIEIDVTNSSGGLSFDWSGGQTTNPAEELTAGTEYTVTVTDAGGCTQEATFSTSSCSLGLTINAIDGSSALANVTDSNGSLEFFWQNTGTGETFTTDQAFVSDLGTGTWLITVVDESDCSASATVNLVSGIDNPGVLIDVQLAPNPTNGLVSISLERELSDDLNLRLFDIRGKELFSKTYDANSSFYAELNLKDLANGMYFIHFSSGKNAFAKRLMLSK